MSSRDRSERGQSYQAWYKQSRWQKIRSLQLKYEPLCRMCLAKGHVTVATICDHVTAHKGDEHAFWYGPFQSLCKHCHDSDKQSLEKSGRSKRVIGNDGWALDD